MGRPRLEEVDGGSLDNFLKGKERVGENLYNMTIMQ